MAPTSSKLPKVEPQLMPTAQSTQSPDGNSKFVTEKCLVCAIDFEDQRDYAKHLGLSSHITKAIRGKSNTK